MYIVHFFGMTRAFVCNARFSRLSLSSSYLIVLVQTMLRNFRNAP